MKEMAQKVRQDSGTSYGYVFQGAQDEGGVVDALEHVWNAGGDVLDGREEIIDSPEAAEGLSLRRSMITDGRSEEHTPELQSRQYLVSRLLLEKKGGLPLEGLVLR